MTDKPTGVFVRLPMSEDQAHVFLKESAHAWDEWNGASDAIACTSGLLAIGTPVTGGELEVVGYAPGEDLPLYGDEGIDDTCFTEISLHQQADNDVPLIRQSDALAKLAEKDAEIARKDATISALIKEQIEMNDKVLEKIQEIMKTLKGPEA